MVIYNLFDISSYAGSKFYLGSFSSQDKAEEVRAALLKRADETGMYRDLRIDPTTLDIGLQ